MTTEPRVIPITAAHRNQARNRRARNHRPPLAEPRPPRRYRIARTITRTAAAAADNIAALFCRWDDQVARARNPMAGRNPPTPRRPPNPPAPKAFTPKSPPITRRLNPQLPGKELLTAVIIIIAYIVIAEITIRWSGDRRRNPQPIEPPPPQDEGQLWAEPPPP